MKVRDCLYRYPGYHGGTAVAHLRVYAHEGSTVALVGELSDNPSTSVTNQAEVIVELLQKRYGPHVIVIEHYPADGHLDQMPTWDSISTVVHPRVPDWRPLSTDEVEMLTGEAVQVWPARDYTATHLLGLGTTRA